MLLLIIFVLLIAVGLPIAFSFGVAGLIYILSFTHFQPQLITTVSFSQLDSFSLMAVPFFIFAGDIMRYGGVSSRLIKFTKSLFKQSTSAVGTITVVASAFFGAISGAAVATVAAIGGIMLPEMKKTGYKHEYSAALASSAGYLGILIPPSIPLLVFGVTSNQSIGDLFIAGIIPGLMACTGMVLLNAWLHKKWMVDKTEMVIEKPQKISLFVGFMEALPGLLMPVIILGGIYGGVFTATEAAAVAIVYGLLVSIFIYKEIKINQILKIAIESARTSAKILFIIALAGFFGRLMTMIHLPSEITKAMLSISENKGSNGSLWSLKKSNEKSEFFC